MPHLITNDSQKAKLRAGLAAEMEAQRILDYIKDEQSHVVYIEDKILNPTDEKKQLGKPLNSDLLEQMLAPVLPSSVRFIDNSWRPGFRAAVRVLRQGDANHGAFETIVPYERGLMPEHSILELVEEEVPDPDVISRRKSLNRKDLGKHEYVRGKGFVFEEGGQIGYIKNKKLGHEVKRGWRTVLVRLVQAGFLSVADAERVFGSSNSAGWAQHVKGHQAVTPW